MRRQARGAKGVGNWQGEINLWGAVEYVLSEQSNIKYSEAQQIRMEARERAATARRNLQNEPLYEHAQLLLNSGNRSAAKTTLKMLWQQAPSYGDPLGLAKKAGLLVYLDPSTKKSLRSFLFLLSLAGMFFSSITLFVSLVLSLLSPVLNWANNLIGYHRPASVPGWLFVVLVIADFFFFVLFLFTRSNGKDKRA